MSFINISIPDFAKVDEIYYEPQYDIAHQKISAFVRKPEKKVQDPKRYQSFDTQKDIMPRSSEARIYSISSFWRADNNSFSTLEETYGDFMSNGLCVGLEEKQHWPFWITDYNFYKLDHESMDFTQTTATFKDENPFTKKPENRVIVANYNMGKFGEPVTSYKSIKFSDNLNGPSLLADENFMQSYIGMSDSVLTSINPSPHKYTSISIIFSEDYSKGDAFKALGFTFDKKRGRMSMPVMFKSRCMRSPLIVIEAFDISKSVERNFPYDKIRAIYGQTLMKQTLMSKQDFMIIESSKLLSQLQHNLQNKSYDEIRNIKNNHPYRIYGDACFLLPVNQQLNADINQSTHDRYEVLIEKPGFTRIYDTCIMIQSVAFRGVLYIRKKSCVTVSPVLLIERVISLVYENPQYLLEFFHNTDNLKHFEYQNRKMAYCLFKIVDHKDIKDEDIILALNMPRANMLSAITQLSGRFMSMLNEHHIPIVCFDKQNRESDSQLVTMLRMKIKTQAILCTKSKFENMALILNKNKESEYEVTPIGIKMTEFMLDNLCDNSHGNDNKYLNKYGNFLADNPISNDIIALVKKYTFNSPYGNPREIGMVILVKKSCKKTPDEIAKEVILNKSYKLNQICPRDEDYMKPDDENEFFGAVHCEKASINVKDIFDMIEISRKQDLDEEKTKKDINHKLNLIRLSRKLKTLHQYINFNSLDNKYIKIEYLAKEASKFGIPFYQILERDLVNKRMQEEINTRKDNEMVLAFEKAGFEFTDNNAKEKDEMVLALECAGFEFTDDKESPSLNSTAFDMFTSINSESENNQSEEEFFLANSEFEDNKDTLKEQNNEQILEDEEQNPVSESVTSENQKDKGKGKNKGNGKGKGKAKRKSTASKSTKQRADESFDITRINNIPRPQMQASSSQMQETGSQQYNQNNQTQYPSFEFGPYPDGNNDEMKEVTIKFFKEKKLYDLISFVEKQEMSGQEKSNTACSSRNTSLIREMLQRKAPKGFSSVEDAICYTASLMPGESELYVNYNAGERFKELVFQAAIENDGTLKYIIDLIMELYVAKKGTLGTESLLSSNGYSEIVTSEEIGPSTTSASTNPLNAKKALYQLYMMRNNIHRFYYVAIDMVEDAKHNREYSSNGTITINYRRYDTKTDAKELNKCRAMILNYYDDNVNLHH